MDDFIYVGTENSIYIADKRNNYRLDIFSFVMGSHIDNQAPFVFSIPIITE